jgi:hypothetical protein
MKIGRRRSLAVSVLYLLLRDAEQHSTGRALLCIWAGSIWQSLTLQTAFGGAKM